MNYKLLFGIAAVLTACNSGDKEYDATGTFEATETTVAAEQAGTLLTFSLEEGDNIEAGTEANNYLGDLEPEEYVRRQRQCIRVRSPTRRSR